jgi:hypothetical protein
MGFKKSVFLYRFQRAKNAFVTKCLQKGNSQRPAAEAHLFSSLSTTDKILLCYSILHRIRRPSR